MKSWKINSSALVIGSVVAIKLLNPLSAQAGDETVTLSNQGPLQVLVDDIDQDLAWDLHNIRSCQGTRYKGALVQPAQFNIQGVRVEAVPRSVVRWCATGKKNIGNFMEIEASDRSRDGLKATYRDAQVNVVLHASIYNVTTYLLPEHFTGAMAFKLTSAENKATFSSGLEIKIRSSRGAYTRDSVFFSQVTVGGRKETRFHSDSMAGFLNPKYRDVDHFDPEMSPLTLHQFMVDEKEVMLRPRGSVDMLTFNPAVEMMPSGEVISGQLSRAAVVDLPSGGQTVPEGQWLDFYSNGTIKVRKGDGQYHRGLSYGPEFYPVEYSSASKNGMCRRLGYDGHIESMPKRIYRENCSRGATYLSLSFDGQTVRPETIKSCVEGVEVIDWIECGKNEAGKVRSL